MWKGGVEVPRRRESTKQFRKLALVHCVMWAVLLVVLALVITRPMPWWLPVIAFSPLLYLLGGVIQLLREFRVQPVPYSLGDIWFTFSQGYTKYDIRSAAQKWEQEENTRAEILEQAQSLTPDLVPRVEQLLENDSLMQARELVRRSVERRQKEAELELRRREQLREQAAHTHCARLVEPLVAAGDFKQAEATMARCAGLIGRAKALGVESEVLAMLDGLKQTNFDSVEALLKKVQDDRDLGRLVEELKERIELLTGDSHQEATAALQSLQQQEFGCRMFRKILHDLDEMLREAEAAPSIS